MVMELLEGRDLRRVMKERGRLPAPWAVEVAVQICEGLAEAHAAGIVHRDLKPPNIYLTRRPDGSELVKVLDFGISKWNEAGSEELTKAGTLLGSPKYMSPEQLSEAGVDTRSDVWAIGVLLYEMLTGRPPYAYANVTQTFVAIAAGTPPPSPRTFEPNVPCEVEAVILRCLVHDKEGRIQNVADLAYQLLESVSSPAAAETRDQLRAVLDPSTAVPGTGSRSVAGRLTLTSGSHSAVSITGARTSLSVTPTPSLRPTPSVTPAPSVTQAPEVVVAAPESQRLRAPRWGVVSGFAAAALLVVLALASRSGNDGVAAAASPRLAERASTMKLLAGEGTSLAASVSVAAPIAAPAPAVRRAPPPPVRAVAPAPSPAPKVAPPASAPEPSAAPPSPPPAASASAKRTAAPLDDRQ
jgi:serine/threonine-protein kinase